MKLIDAISAHHNITEFPLLSYEQTRSGSRFMVWAIGIGNTMEFVSAWDLDLTIDFKKRYDYILTDMVNAEDQYRKVVK